MNKIGESNIDGIQLLGKIAKKDSDIEAAKDAFEMFVGYFESKIKTFVEVNAKRLGFNENVAFEALQCTFNKVWLYPSFDMRKAHCKNEERAIILWLNSIATSQMFQYTKEGVCAQIKEDEDLSVIENSEELINLHFSGYSPEDKYMLVQALNDKISVLDEKHKIIYLTYRAYYNRGKKLPRTVLEKLRKRLGLKQVTIRVYKKEACESLNDLELLKA